MTYKYEDQLYHPCMRALPPPPWNTPTSTAVTRSTCHRGGRAAVHKLMSEHNFWEIYWMHLARKVKSCHNWIHRICLATNREYAPTGYMMVHIKLCEFRSVTDSASYLQYYVCTGTTNYSVKYEHIDVTYRRASNKQLKQRTEESVKLPCLANPTKNRWSPALRYDGSS